MKVSLNTVRQFTNVDIGVEELVEKINQQLGAVEEVVDLGKLYEGTVIARVLKCVKHPDADKLSVCEIDAGTGENIQVVCGAPNVREDLWVVWLQPGATVPATANDKEPFVLGARELRGVVSNGMLASAKELALGDDHNGIVELIEADLLNGKALEAGASFAETFGLDDTIIDIENKMFTHRPDLFGQLGVAREIAGIQNQQFKSPDWYLETPQFAETTDLELEVVNEAADAVPRFMAVAMKDVVVRPSPLWLQCALVAMGGKPINNIVDVTNYVMLMTAQPTHAYDYDKLRSHKLGVRMAHEGEQLPLLNGKTYTLNDRDIVIVDGEGPVGLGGIMGGGNSEVSTDTKNIVLEVANFDMYAVRRSSMRHGLFTDALTRFNKGQSPLQNDKVLAFLMQLVTQLASAQQASRVYDLPNNLPEPQAVRTSTKFVNDRLGIELEPKVLETLLGNVEFGIDTDSQVERWFKAPFWRTDIELPEDIVEEVGRLYGYDKLPRELPERSMAPAAINPTIAIKQKIRQNLARSGANEVLTYSFVHQNIMKKSEQDASQAFQLSNALSPDLQYYRLSVLPSLLDKVHMNIKAGHNEFALFEIGKGHHKAVMGEDGLPIEFDRIALVRASKNPAQGAPFFAAKAYVTELMQQFGITKDVWFQKTADFDADYDALRQMCAPFDPQRSAMVMIGHKFGGIVGELKQSVIRGHKLPPNTAACELFLSMFEHAASPSTYQALSKFPSVTQDISLRVAADTKYSDVYETAHSTLEESSDRDYRLSLLDIYQAEGTDQKTVTLRLKTTDHQRTLTDQEVSSVIDTVADAAQQKLGAERL